MSDHPRLIAHFGAGHVPEMWREELCELLGYRPRRLGTLTELAMYGALNCLALTDERALPPGAILRVTSRHGQAASFMKSFEDANGDMPMPFAFLQSQPSQMLAALAKCLSWQGDAYYVMSDTEQALRQLMFNESASGGMLLGWVEEPSVFGTARSEWWRIAPA